jgi:dnd system-associated protein 4
MGKPIISYRKTDLYERVVDEYEVFENYYDFLVFLAVIGYRENNPIRSNYRGSGSDGTKGEIGLQNVRSNDLYRTIMACLAFQDTGDPESLVDSSTQMRVLSQYAAGGVEVAEREFGEVAGDPTDAILNYIRRRQDEEPGHGGELERIVESFDDEMMGIEQD